MFWPKKINSINLSNAVNNKILVSNIFDGKNEISLNHQEYTVYARDKKSLQYKEIKKKITANNCCLKPTNNQQLSNILHTTQAQAAVPAFHCSSSSISFISKQPSSLKVLLPALSEQSLDFQILCRLVGSACFQSG